MHGLLALTLLLLACTCNAFAPAALTRFAAGPRMVGDQPDAREGSVDDEHDR